jgi:predicted HNH restriction endonuclease
MTSHTPNYAAGYIIGNFCLSYLLLSNQTLKQLLQDRPQQRDDVSKYGEQAVREGKLSQRALNMIKRNEAAHENSIAHFPFFCAGMVS